MKVVIIACVKCEERYIREWLDYHISIGFDHFYLADNNEESHTPTLESVIKDYVSNGLVTIIDCRGMIPVQPHCYNMVMMEYGNEYNWCAMIDVDEFFCLPKHANIKDFLKDFPNDTDIIHLHWRFYGDNGLLTYDDRPVQERFTKPTNINGIKDGFCTFIKSLFRNKEHIENKIGEPLVINDHHCVFHNDKATRRNSLGEQMETPSGFFCPFKKEEYDVAYLKHFITKTVEEYIEKRNRGDSFRKDGCNAKYSERFFFFYNEETAEKKEYIKQHLV